MLHKFNVFSIGKESTFIFAKFLEKIYLIALLDLYGI